jgi:hypothetical protein
MPNARAVPQHESVFLSHIFPWERWRGAVVAMASRNHRDVPVRVLRMPLISRSQHSRSSPVIPSEAAESPSERSEHIPRDLREGDSLP